MNSDESGLLVGLDIGGTKTAVLVADRALNVVGRGSAATDVSSPQNLVTGIYEAVVHTLTVSGRDPAELMALGAGVPGMVDSYTGDVRLAVNLNLEHFPLGTVLSERFAAPTALENDVRAASLGVYRWLNEQTTARTIAYLSIGTGISAGVVLDGNLYRGPQGMAGEIGHIVFEPHGNLCPCGLHGCLESIAAGPAIARQWPQGDGTAQSVFAAAAAGDRSASQIINHAGAAIARAVQLLVMTYDVEKVVLGGGVINAGEAILDPIYATLAAMRRQSNLAKRMLAADKVIVAPAQADVARWGAVLLAQRASETAGS